ncbi:MAG TPA: Cof-type HAD-IIB family hydrolase, partial [Candidatus Fusicatenibacter merdavium]|nr:Cof-type HAD-IIB family hydrolase [Candidatus Fusicatenibacter merdavium]
AGKILVLASGRPINGVAPLAASLNMSRYKGYMLSFNGGRITRCSSGETIYNRTLPPEVIRPIWEYIRTIPGLNVISYNDTQIISGIQSNRYDEIESRNSIMEIVPADDFPSAITFPVNKMIVSGDPELIAPVIAPLQEKYRNVLSIYLSEPFFLEIMPLHVDKARALQKLLETLGLTADNMICCGDGYNDISMIRYAGLGAAMGNAQPAVKDAADYITRSNDEDGILDVIHRFMR